MKTDDLEKVKVSEVEKEDENSESEYGKGFTYCLALFITHFNNNQMERLANISYAISKLEEEQTKILSDNPDGFHSYGWNKDVEWWFEKIVPIYGDIERAFSSDLTTWMNGASDHLYELECPEVFKGTEIEEKVNELRDFGLDMGHGAGLMGRKSYNWNDVVYLKELTGSILKLLDGKLGIDVVDARWGEL